MSDHFLKQDSHEEHKRVPENICTQDYPEGAYGIYLVLQFAATEQTREYPPEKQEL